MQAVPDKEVNNNTVLNFSLPFEEAVKSIKSTKGKPLKHGSGSWCVLRDMFYGNTIDAYDAVPLNLDGNRVHNVTQRVFDLQDKYGITVESERIEGSNVMQYWLDTTRQSIPRNMEGI